VLQGTESVLRTQHLPREMRGSPAANSANSANPASSLDAASPLPAPAAAIDVSNLLAALRATGGNLTRAAAQLGVTRQRAYRLLQEQSVDLASLSGPRRTKR